MLRPHDVFKLHACCWCSPASRYWRLTLLNAHAQDSPDRHELDVDAQRQGRRAACLALLSACSAAGAAAAMRS